MSMTFSKKESFDSYKCGECGYWHVGHRVEEKAWLPVERVAGQKEWVKVERKNG